MSAPNIAEIINYIDRKIAHEKDLLAGISDKNSCGAGASFGAIEVLHDVRDFITLGGKHERT